MIMQLLPGACAQFAMQAALLVLGEPISLVDLYKVTGTNVLRARRDGTSESAILRGLKQLGYKAKAFNCESSAACRIAMDQELALGNACVICVEDAEHWAAILGKHQDKYVWYDGMDDDLVGKWGWSRVSNWITDGSDEAEYYFISIRPKLGISLVKNMEEAYPTLRKLCASWFYIMSRKTDSEYERIHKLYAVLP